ncbi:MAG: hypothetical protein H8D80_02000 [Proteobacteria bacterium]|nr:hypothetical protein [Pseudomonadota bacterium]
MKRFKDYIKESYLQMLGIANLINNELPHSRGWHDALVKAGKGQIINSQGNADEWTTDIGVPILDSNGFPLLNPNDPNSGVPWWEHPAYGEGTTIDLLGEQFDPRRKIISLPNLNEPGGALRGLGGNRGDLAGNYENPWQNEGPGDDFGIPGDGSSWDEYWEWLKNLPNLPDQPDPIEVQLSSGGEDSGGDVNLPSYGGGTDLEEPIKTVKDEPTIDVQLDSGGGEVVTTVDPTLFDDPYLYAGVTNDYGMLRKKNINFNET